MLFHDEGATYTRNTQQLNSATSTLYALVSYYTYVCVALKVVEADGMIKIVSHKQ